MPDCRDILENNWTERVTGSLRIAGPSTTALTAMLARALARTSDELPGVEKARKSPGVVDAGAQGLNPHDPDLLLRGSELKRRLFSI